MRLAACLVALSLASCASLRISPPSCTPAFPYAEGWLGGDAAYSIALGDGRTLWLFGDTFVGAPGATDRRGSTFIHNSVAISRCTASGFEIDYAWRTGDDDSPRAFVEREGGGYFWLFDGFVHDRRLYIGLLEVAEAEPTGPLALPFRFDGFALGRIEDFHGPPESWRVETIRVSSSDSVIPAGAMVVADGFLWMFTFVDRRNGEFPRGIARLPLSALDGTAKSVSEQVGYFDQQGTFREGVSADELRILMPDDGTEMSVHFDGERWLAVYSFPDTDDFPSTAPADEIWLRTAARLEGPWSEPFPIYHVPELRAPDRDPNTGCYAAKQHPQFDRSDGAITITYVCNLFAGPGQDAMAIFGRLLADMALYRPVAVEVDLRDRQGQLQSEPAR